MKKKTKKRNQTDNTLRNVRAANKRFKKLEGYTNSYATAWDIKEINKRLVAIEDWITKVTEASNNPQVKTFTWKPDKKRLALIKKQFKSKKKDFIDSIYEFKMQVKK